MASPIIQHFRRVTACAFHTVQWKQLPIATALCAKIQGISLLFSKKKIEAQLVRNANQKLSQKYLATCTVRQEDGESG